MVLLHLWSCPRLCSSTIVVHCWTGTGSYAFEWTLHIALPIVFQTFSGFLLKQQPKIEFFGSFPKGLKNTEVHEDYFMTWKMIDANCEKNKRIKTENLVWFKFFSCKEVYLHWVWLHFARCVSWEINVWTASKRNFFRKPYCRDSSDLWFFLI